MRIIEAAKVTEVVRRLCIEANCHLTSDLKDCITACRISSQPGYTGPNEYLPPGSETEYVSPEGCCTDQKRNVPT